MKLAACQFISWSTKRYAGRAGQSLARPLFLFWNLRKKIAAGPAVAGPAVPGFSVDGGYSCAGGRLAVAFENIGFRLAKNEKDFCGLRR